MKDEKVSVLDWVAFIGMMMFVMHSMMYYNIIAVAEAAVRLY